MYTLQPTILCGAKENSYKDKQSNNRVGNKAVKSARKLILESPRFSNTEEGIFRKGGGVDYLIALSTGSQPGHFFSCDYLRSFSLLKVSGT